MEGWRNRLGNLPPAPAACRTPDAERVGLVPDANHPRCPGAERRWHRGSGTGHGQGLRDRLKSLVSYSLSQGCPSICPARGRRLLRPQISIRLAQTLYRADSTKPGDHHHPQPPMAHHPNSSHQPPTPHQPRTRPPNPPAGPSTPPRTQHPPPEPPPPRATHETSQPATPQQPKPGQPQTSDGSITTTTRP